MRFRLTRAIASLGCIAILAACSGTQSTITPTAGSLSAPGGSSSLHHVQRAVQTQTNVEVYNSYSQTIYPGCCLTTMGPTCPTLTPYPLPSVPAGKTSQAINMNFQPCTALRPFTLLYAPNRAAYDTCGLIVTPGSTFTYGIWTDPNGTDTDCTWTLDADGNVVFTYAQVSSLHRRHRN